MQNIFIVGDSHSIFYYYSKTPNIKHHWTGWAKLPVTLFELVKLQNFPLYNIVERYSPGDVCKINIKDYDFVVFCYGWNDIQKNIHKYNKNNYKEIIDYLCEKYINLIIKLPYNIYPIINCVYPISPDKENNINIFGNYEERIKYTNYMNNKLQEICNKNNIPFFNIYEKLNNNGLLSRSVTNPNGDHLDEFNEELRNDIENDLLNLINDYKKKEVTLFITSCGRQDLLKKTLISFMKYNTYPIKQVIICEDSGYIDCNLFIKDILPFPIKFCYNEIRIGQMKTIEKYIKLVNTDYIFHLEDDYEFFEYSFIELSFKILDSDNNISQVLLEDEQHNYYKVDINNSLCYKVLTNNPSDKEANNGDGALNVFSWRPSLKKKEISLLRIPYKQWDDEYTIQLEVNKRNLYAVVTTKENGFCKHIGKNNHIYPNVKNSNEKIIGRIDFPEYVNIKLKDI